MTNASSRYFRWPFRHSPIVGPCSDGRITAKPARVLWVMALLTQKYQILSKKPPVTRKASIAPCCSFGATPVPIGLGTTGDLDHVPNRRA